MIPDSITRDQLERIPDPRPGPDMEAADLIDGSRVEIFGLYAYAAVFVRLPPRVVEAIAEADRLACALHTLDPDDPRRKHYRPSMQALAERCGYKKAKQLRAVLNRAILATRRAAEGAPTSPPGEGSAAGLPLSPRSRRGGEERVTNAGRAAGKRGRKRREGRD